MSVSETNNPTEMKQLLIAPIAFTILASSASAAIVVTAVTSATGSVTNSAPISSPYDGDILTNDLINLATTTLGSVTPAGSFGFDSNGIWDGVGYNAGGNQNGTSYFNNGNPVTFTFALTGSASGYDITSITSIAGWYINAHNHAAQNYEVLISTVTIPTYTALTLTGAVDVKEKLMLITSGSGGYATKITIDDSSGSIATGVTGIQFKIYRDAGDSVYHEIDVLVPRLSPPRTLHRPARRPGSSCPAAPPPALIFSPPSGIRRLFSCAPWPLIRVGALLSRLRSCGGAGPKALQIENSFQFKFHHDLSSPNHKPKTSCQPSLIPVSSSAAAALLLATPAHADHVKVILLGGQSNMVGNYTLTSELPAVLQDPQADVLFYNGSLTTLRPGSGGQFGPEVTFGRTIADAFPSETFCLIKYAVNGSSLLTNWNPATGTSYASFRTRVENGIAALTAAGHTYEIAGMLWTQGEAEAADGTTTPGLSSRPERIHRRHPHALRPEPAVLREPAFQFPD